MAISTFGVTLKWGTSPDNLTKKVDIKSFPDLGGAPEMLETTTLSDSMQTYILGIQSADAMEFEYNYDKTTYEQVEADANVRMFYSLEFGTNGSEGKFTWEGMHSTHIVGGGVNEVVGGVITVAPATKPVMGNSSDIYVQPINDFTMTAGNSRNVSAVASPAGCAIAAESDNEAVTVTVSGNVVTVNAVSAGEANVKVTATKSGYTTETETFKVTVNE
jgi:hypothetical protein